MLQLSNILASEGSPFHRGKAYYGRPFDSTQGVPPIVGLIAIAIIFFFIIRVWWALRKDRK
jgi:hypothetical protein